MQKRYFTQQEFNENFGNEMALAADVYAERKKTGMDDNALAVYDFIFISDSKDKLEEHIDLSLLIPIILKKSPEMHKATSYTFPRSGLLFLYQELS
jgi:hypothetical protein